LPEDVCPMTKEPLRERTSPTNSGFARTCPQRSVSAADPLGTDNEVRMTPQ
jgi:hypothetical protein